MIIRIKPVETPGCHFRMSWRTEEKDVVVSVLGRSWMQWWNTKVDVHWQIKYWVLIWMVNTLGKLLIDMTCSGSLD